MTNPDFRKIAQSGFQDYYYELFTETLKRYYPNDNVFSVWQEGITARLFQPQFHGREHVNVQMWLEYLLSLIHILSARFDRLITELRNRYDYIIVDNVPAGIVADASIVNRVVDLTIFVVRSGVMDRRQLPELENMYRQEQLHNLSVILNGVPLEHRGYGYGYGNGYGYGYGYGYGNDTHKHTKMSHVRKILFRFWKR